MALGRLATYRNRPLAALTVFIQARDAVAVECQPPWEPDAVENDYYRLRNYPRS